MGSKKQFSLSENELDPAQFHLQHYKTLSSTLEQNAINPSHSGQMFCNPKASFTMEKRSRIGGVAEDQKALNTEIRVSSQFHIMDLPTADLHEILFRLPINSIMNLKYVCRALYKLISNPDFALNYTNNSPLSTVLIPTITKSSSIWKHSEYFDLLQVSDNYDCIRTTFKPKIPSRPTNVIYGFSVVGTSNGLLCLSVHTCRTESVYVCNPIRGECMPLPRREIKRGQLDAEYGFGFCRSTNKYKVLRIFCKLGSEYAEQEGHIFTIGIDNKWRVLANQTIPFCFTSPFCFSYKFIALNGTFHWIVKNDDSAWISTLDLGEEKVGRLSHPHGLVLDPYFMKLESINNQLYLLDSSNSSEIVLWKMKEYGVAESWTKDIIVDISCISVLRRRRLVPVTILKNGDVLFSSRLGENLISYNPIKRKLTQIPGFCYEIFTYAPSFLSLKEAVMGGHQSTINMLSK